MLGDPWGDAVKELWGANHPSLPRAALQNGAGAARQASAAPAQPIRADHTVTMEPYSRRHSLAASAVPRAQGRSW